tara:strand:+ start:179 stop:451 length:273 start_codon:yes stop_codon:yes gene_type:complete
MVDYFKHFSLTQNKTMGFNKLHLPDLEYLKESLKEKGNEEFVNFWTMRYARADALIGPPESMDFIKQIIDREYNYRTTGQISIDFDQVED